MKKLNLFFLIFCFVPFFQFAISGYLIPNQGQWPKEVLFAYKTGGLNAFITQKGVIFDFYKITSASQDISRFPKHDGIVTGQVVRLEWNGCNFPQPEFSNPENKTAFHFITMNGAFSVEETFKEIILKNIYPKTDLRWYIQDGYLRFDFILHPGANPNLIKMKLDGCSAFINEGQQLILNTQIGDVKICDLHAYQENRDYKKNVFTRWKQENNTFQFHIGSYNATIPLIIDPLVFSTLIGSSANEGGYAIARDNNGDLYIAGETYGAGFPTTTGSYSTTLAGNKDGFISKFNSNGSSLIYSTFIGGSSADVIYGIYVNNNGEIIACGSTSSSNFPTFNAYDNSYNGGPTDGFLLKLNSTGSNLLFSTFLGGSSDEEAYAVYPDTTGRILVVGYTSSANFPVQAGYDMSHNGLTDGFVSCLTANGMTLAYSTFIGGSSNDYVYAVRTNTLGQVIVAGSTTSGNFPVTSGAYDNSYGGATDAFVSALNFQGNNLDFSSYLGDTGTEEIYGIDVNLNNNIIYATGYTNSSNFPTTAGVISTTKNTGYDAFISALAPNASTLNASTFYGGNSDDYAYCIDVNGNGDVFVSGYVASNNLALSANAYDPSYNGGSYDAFVLKTNSGLTSVQYGTYIGGNGIDGGQAIVSDNLGYAWLTGFASSTFPVTLGAYDISFNGSTYDAFLLKICTGLSPYANAVPPTVCEGKTLALSGGPSGFSSYTWSGPNSYTASGQNVSYTNVPITGGGAYTLTVQDASGCSGKAIVNVSVLPSPNTSVSVNGNTLSSQQSGASYQWHDCSNMSPIPGATLQNFTPANAGTFMVVIQLPGGCSDTSSCISFTPTGFFETHHNLNWSFYPNPSSGEIFFSNAAGHEMEWYDINGKRVASYVVKSNNDKFYLSLPAGTYILLNRNTGERKKWISLQ
jgi:hypothetical protein